MLKWMQLLLKSKDSPKAKQRWKQHKLLQSEQQLTKGLQPTRVFGTDIIGDTAHRIDKLSKMYADQINNMPKALRARIDDDFAGVLDSINNAFNADPSPGNAASVELQVKNSLDSIEKDLAEASRAVLKASIEHIAQQKMTELQEKEMVLMSVERGMTKGQRDASRALVKEIRSLILDLGQSNFLVYDKIIRNQKLQVIDHKLSDS